MSGWIKKHRKMLDWTWYKDVPTCRLFDHLLMIANYKPHSFMGRTIGIGQIATGRISLASETGLSQQQVRTALEKLKSTNDITIEATSHFSLITIVNWDFYQGEDETSTNQNHDDQPTKNQKSTTIKERNNISPKGDIDNNAPAKEEIKLPDWLPVDAWQSFVDHRKGSKFSPHARKLAIKVLTDLRSQGHDPVEVINQSIVSNWQGLFALKGKWNGQNQGNYRTHTAKPTGDADNGGTGYGGRRSQTEQYNDATERLIAERRARAAQDQGLFGQSGSVEPPSQPDLLSAEEVRGSSGRGSITGPGFSGHARELHD